MKKILIWALTPLFLCLSLFPLLFVKNRVVVLAETARLTPLTGDYACILSDSTYFLSLPDSREGLFLLPKSYYVRLLEYGNEYCRIEYLTNESSFRRLTGYAKTSELTFVDYVPMRPYLYYEFDVTYTMGENSVGNSSFLDKLTVTCIYYGDFRIGAETYCYVLRGEEFGYIPKPTGIRYEENTEYADRQQALLPPESMESSETKSSSPAQIAILVTLCLLIPVLAALILKPPRRPPYETDD